jgi:hypothetical protein
MIISEDDGIWRMRKKLDSYLGQFKRYHCLDSVVSQAFAKVHELTILILE